MIAKHGTIDGVRFRKVGWSINALAYSVKLTKDGQTKTVHVNNITELKHEIANFDGQ